MAVAELTTCPDCRRQHRGRCGRYTGQQVDLMVDGAYFSELEGAFKEAPDLENFQWSRVRSVIEATGNVDSPLFTGVIDLERAVAALSRKGGQHALGALILNARMTEISTEKLEEVLTRSGHDPERIERQAKAFVGAWLSGDDPDAAWRRAGHRRPQERPA